MREALGMVAFCAILGATLWLIIAGAFIAGSGGWLLTVILSTVVLPPIGIGGVYLAGTVCDLIAGDR